MTPRCPACNAFTAPSTPCKRCARPKPPKPPPTRMGRPPNANSPTRIDRAWRARYPDVERLARCRYGDITITLWRGPGATYAWRARYRDAAPYEADYGHVPATTARHAADTLVAQLRSLFPGARPGDVPG